MENNLKQSKGKIIKYEIKELYFKSPKETNKKKYKNNYNTNCMTSTETSEKMRRESTNKLLTDVKHKNYKDGKKDKNEKKEKLYCKKKIDSTRVKKNYLNNLFKTNKSYLISSSTTQIKNKIILQTKHKMFISKDNTTSDIDDDLEKENDENIKIHVPHLTSKKNSNYFLGYHDKKVNDDKGSVPKKLKGKKNKGITTLYVFNKEKIKDQNLSKKISQLRTPVKNEENKEDNKEENKENFNYIQKSTINKKYHLNKFIKNLKYNGNTPLLNKIKKVRDITVSTKKTRNIFSNISRKKKINLENNIMVNFLNYQTKKCKTIRDILLTSNRIIKSELNMRDSSENITEVDEDKLSPFYHRNNLFFMNKFYRDSQNKEENIYLYNTEENCFANKTNMSLNNSKMHLFSNKNNNSILMKKSTQLSLILSPIQSENNHKMSRRFIKRKNILVIFNLSDLFTKDKFKKISNYIEGYLDQKSLIKLSSIDKKYYNKFRISLFKFIYEKTLPGNYIKKEQNQFINKIIKSIFQNSSKQFKNSKNLKVIFNLFKSKSKCDKEIMNDLTRTFPEDSSFSKGSINYQKLYNILTSYSNFNKKIGYAQGMNFICAMAINIFDSEEKAFLFLDSIINKFELESFFSVENKSIIMKLKNYSDILNKYIPEIVEFFDKNKINHGFFTTSWILTLFSNSMSKECLLITWSYMIIFGWKFFFSLSIQILIWYKNEIFNTNVNELCYKMRNLLSGERFKLIFNNIIKLTFSFMNKHIIL